MQQSGQRPPGAESDEQARPAAGRGGARRRRRGLYGPPPRLTSSGPIAGRLVWHIGDWGRASEHIGNRWEEVAVGLLRRRLGRGDELIVLAAEPELMAQVIGSGLPHADAFRAWAAGGRLAMEPLDFKWSLETASVKQVSAETLGRLQEAHVPRFEAALETARSALGLEASSEVEADDGRFVAPEHPANRAALRDDPELPSTLLPVDAQQFFRPLPGWPTAQAVARLEGVDLDRVTSLESVERYYRLGAGVLGALVRLGTGLFDEEPATVDGPEGVARLRRSGIAPTLHAVLLHLEQSLAGRRAQEDQLASIPRLAYPFGRFRTDLARLGVPKSVTESRGAIGRLHGEVMREVGAAVREAGRRLLVTGVSEADALARLATETERWTALGSRHAREIADRLAPRTGRNEPPVAPPRQDGAPSRA